MGSIVYWLFGSAEVQDWNKYVAADTDVQLNTIESSKSSQ